MSRIDKSAPRSRWPFFAGTLLALALGTCLMATMGSALASAITAPDRPPVRYAAAPSVVRADEVLRVKTPQGREDSRPLAEHRGLPAGVVDALAATGPVVVDRTFEARVLDGTAGRAGHPWATAAFTPYTLVLGRAPATDGEIVVTDPAAVPGTRVPVLTREGTRTYTIAGVARAATGEPAEDAPVFFTDAAAARISPRIDAVVAYGPSAAVARAAGRNTEVLTGNARARAEAVHDRDRDALAGTMALVGTSAGVCVFASVFVVASTSSFAAARRSREFALLRAIGASRGRVRRMVLSEAAAAGALGAAAGCLLSLAAAPPFGRLLAREGLAPGEFTVDASVLALCLAGVTGLVVALIGASIAARRVIRVRPVEALRDSSAERRGPPVARLLCGAALIGGALVLLGAAVVTDPASAGNRKTSTPIAMLLIAGAALVAPLPVPLVTRVLTRPLARLAGPAGNLVRRNATGSPGRTAASAAPIVVTVGLTVCLLGATATAGAADVSRVRNTLRADFVIVPDGLRGLPADVVDRVAATPGAESRTTVPTSVYVVEGGAALIERPAWATDPRSLDRFSEVRTVAGSLGAPGEDRIVIDEDWDERRVGDTIDVWLADGTPRRLTVAAVTEGDGGAFVSPGLAGTALPDKIYVRLLPGADRNTVEAALTAAADGAGARVLTARQWIGAADDDGGRHSRAGLLVVLGLTVVYTSIAIANTLALTTRDRARELALLRLLGAQRGQAVRIVTAEALVPVAVGAALGFAAGAVQVLGMWPGMLRYAGWTPPVLPWAATAAVTVTGALIATAATAAAAALALRTPPVEAAASA